MTESTQLPAGSWVIDPSAADLAVTVKKLGLFPIPATLTLVSGRIEISETGEVSNVEIVADASSYASKNAKRNEHVVSADFLDAETHPAIEFRSNSVTPTAGGYTAKGNITMKGRTSPVDAVITNVEVSGDTGSFEAAMTVDRLVLGVDKLPTIVIGQQLEVSVKATART